jgi:hypothetical protein
VSVPLASVNAGRSPRASAVMSSRIERCIAVDP